MLSQVKLAIVGALITFTAITTWQARGWYEDSKQKKIVEKEIEVHNENEKIIAEKVKTVEKIKIVYRDKIVQLPGTVVNADCPDDPSTELRNSSARLLDPKLFERTDAVPAETE